MRVRERERVKVKVMVKVVNVLCFEEEVEGRWCDFITIIIIILIK